MTNAVFAGLSLVLLAVFGISACRLHERKTLLYLLPALFVTGGLIGFETLLCYTPSLLYGGMKLLLINQVLLCPAWLLFSLAYGRGFSLKDTNNLDRAFLVVSVLPLAIVLALPVSAFYFQTDFSIERVIFLEPGAFYFSLFLVVLHLLCIANLESTLHSSRHSEQWRLKLALLGAGTILIALAIFFSQGLISRAMDMNNLPLRNAGIALGLMLMLYAEWRRESAQVTISRTIAFNSLIVAVAGAYLLGLAFLRESTRLFGEAWQGILIFAALVSALGILLLALSQTFRRKASIWFQLHLYNEKYDYRRQWMLFSARLSLAADSDSLVDELLISFCETFGRVGAFFMPVDKDVPSRVMPGRYYEIDDLETAQTIPLADYSPLLALPATPRVIDEKKMEECSPSLAQALHGLGISLFMPVRAAEEMEGLLFLGRPIDGREKFDLEDVELMEAMNRQFGLTLRSFRLSAELATARELEALGKLGAFVLHDLKNQVYALSLLSDNARRFISDAEFQKDMLETLVNTVANMKILISQLTHLPSVGNLRLEEVDLHGLAAKACGLISHANVRISGGHPVVRVDVEQISKVFTNLCLNAVEAGGDRPIRVEILEEGPVFRIHDEAGGIAEEIMRQGLFKPFNSIKQHGMGIGLYHCKKIAEAHGAKIQVENRPGIGCTFSLCFSSNNLPSSTDPASV